MMNKRLLQDTLALIHKESFKRKTLRLDLPAPAHAPAPVQVHPQPVHSPLLPPAASPKPLSSTPIPPSQTPAPAPQTFRTSITRHFPQLQILEKIPSDAAAKENAALWKKARIDAAVLVLSFGEKEEDLLFLKNLAKAIHTRLVPTKMIDALAFEREKRWESFFQINSFELIIAQEEALMRTEELRRLLDSPLLAKTARILLTDALKQDKATLWKKVCQLAKK